MGILINGIATQQGASAAASAAGTSARKERVRVATAAALPAYTRSGNIITADADGALATVDGATLVAGDRLLLKDGADGEDNGIYEVSFAGDVDDPFVLTRVTDADGSAELKPGTEVFVSEGSATPNTTFVLTTDDPITLNTTALTFALQPTGYGTAGTSGLSNTAGTANTAARSDHTHLQASASIGALNLKAPVAAGTGFSGAAFVLRVPMVAAGPGAADDITVFAANAPLAFRIIDTFMNVLTNIADATVQARTAAAGGGSALSDALSAAAAGVVRQAALTASPTIAANGSLYVRRADNGVAGELFLVCMPA